MKIDKQYKYINKTTVSKIKLPLVKSIIEIQNF